MFLIACECQKYQIHFCEGLAGHPHVRGTSLRNDLIPPMLLIPFHPYRFPTDFIFLPFFLVFDSACEYLCFPGYLKFYLLLTSPHNVSASSQRLSIFYTNDT